MIVCFNKFEDFIRDPACNYVRNVLHSGNITPTTANTRAQKLICSYHLRSNRVVPSVGHTMVVILIINLVIRCPTKFRTAKNTIHLTVSDPLDLVNVLVKMCFCFRTFYQHSRSKITNKFKILIWSSKISFIPS